MFVRVLFFVLGLVLSIIGLVYDISYLNLLTMGYNFCFYVKFIFSRIECLLFFIGIFIMFFSLFLKGDNNELRL